MMRSYDPMGRTDGENGGTYPAMDTDDLQPHFFIINGCNYPLTDTLNVKTGQRVLLRFVDSGQFIHPMRLHGQPFTIVGTDGDPGQNQRG